MGKDSPNQKEKEPKCLAALDFKILSEMLGKDEAIKIMLTADALGKKASTDSVPGSHPGSSHYRPPGSASKEKK